MPLGAELAVVVADAENKLPKGAGFADVACAPKMPPLLKGGGLADVA